MAKKTRRAKLTRTTRETDITVELNVDGTGKTSISTGIPFFDHMLELLGRHSLMDLTIKAKGDIEVDYHHTVEDVGLALGECLDKALGDRKGITRYGAAMLPMDDCMSQVAVDLGGRPYLVYNIHNKKRKIRDFDVVTFTEFFQSLTVQGRMNLHINQLYGVDVHHAYESVFKGLARALRQAVAIDPREKGIPSSKGTI
jgi:imidazoleglycerol-phosphate dehydratase